MQRTLARHERRHRLAHVVRAADGLDGNGFDHQRLARHQESVVLAIPALELGNDAGNVGNAGLQCRVGSLVLEVKRARRRDA